MVSRKAAERHCSQTTGVLKRTFGFKCGRFEQTLGGISATWAEAKVTTTMDLYGEGFAPVRAVDDDEETYFWAIAPKEHDTFEVSWLNNRDPNLRLGKWFRKLSARTGAIDRPGDRLLKGGLWVQQWKLSPDDKTYHAGWVRVASFEDGRASAEGGELLEGPVVAVRIMCEEYQVQWMSLVDILAEPGEPKAHPTAKELPQPKTRHRREHERYRAGSSYSQYKTLDDAVAAAATAVGDASESQQPSPHQSQPAVAEAKAAGHVATSNAKESLEQLRRASGGEKRQRQHRSSEEASTTTG